ncbi:hypothetical protein AB0K12_48235 [Nonomuraea sp. NPDC049419]|uniref:rhamnogalacturonan endolyase family protein n=1 Tax=Nonomuraea sp. NPDC049419 TaxID=3155772 RepID=UPI003449A992
MSGRHDANRAAYFSWPFLGLKGAGAGTGGGVGAGFSVCRDGRPIATVTDGTDYLELAGTPASKYVVAPIARGKEGRSAPARTLG